MAARLDEAARAWESMPFAETSKRLFLANHPQWIPEYRERIQRAESAGEALRLRHRLALELLWAGQTRAALADLHRLRAAVEASSAPASAKAPLLQRLRADTAVAFLRLGEELNCLASHNADSCIFPLRGGGVHTSKEPARAAADVLLESLRADPSDLRSRWLLNLAHMTLGAYPQDVPREFRIPDETFDSEKELKRFRDVARQRGLDALGLAGGCAVDDFDGDGDLDIFASSWGLRDQLRFFRQQGDGQFVDATREAGLEGEVGGLNLSHADADGDGDLDVLVLRGGWLGENGRHPNSLLRNRGDGTFEDATEASGLLSRRPSQTAAWADFDRDGLLDLFIGCEQETKGEDRSQLFRAEAPGEFRDVASESGLADLGFVKGAAWGDVDGDGWPDLYLSRIGQPNLLLRNEGRARDSGGWVFRDVTSRAGVAEPVYSFPCWFFDYDQDGLLDIFVAGFDGAGIGAVCGEYLGQPHRRGKPRLYRNAGGGRFRDVTSEAGLDRVLLAMGANFGDLDGDGWPDVYIGTGAPALSTLMPNRMFRNAGGRSFQDVTTSGGFGHLQKGHGIAFADVDGDGDQDVYAVMGGWYTGDVYRDVLFENPGHGNRWITLRLEGTQSNRFGVGARVRVRVETADGLRDIFAWAGTGGSFGGGSHQLEIGLGRAQRILGLSVRWPSGEHQVLKELELDRVHDLREPEATTREP